MEHFPPEGTPLPPIEAGDPEYDPFKEAKRHDRFSTAERKRYQCTNIYA